MMDEINVVATKKSKDASQRRVMVVAATNLPHLIDKSLLRPGMMCNHLEINFVRKVR